jgi:hypothetical protein
MLLLQADRRCEAFTDVHVNLVGAAAEAFMGEPALGTKAVTPGGASTAVVAASGGAFGGAGECCWGESDERALLEALKKFGKDLGPERCEGQ